MKTNPVLAFLAAAMAISSIGLASAQEQEVPEIVEIRFHGNYSIPDAQMAEWIDAKVGEMLTAEIEEDIVKRLRETGRFENVGLRKRYRSISRTDRVVLIIAVREKPPLAKKFMYGPILRINDEYGFTFGMRMTAIDMLGKDERLSFPLSWGGVRQAAVEGQFPLTEEWTHQINPGARWSQKKNPHFDVNDRRTELWIDWIKRWKSFQVDVGSGWTDVLFEDLDDRFVTIGAGAAWDTRSDVNLPSDAIYVGFGWQHMTILDGGPSFNRYKTDLRGYKRLFGQIVIASQFFYHSADGRLPDYQRPLLGGAATLRGHPAGEFIGDNIVLAAAELRIPLTSPFSFARAGVNIFFDSGAVYDYGEKIGDAQFHQGAGVGLFVFAFGLGLKVELGFDLEGSSEFHFSTGFRF